jgi:HTH-type transcriptional regulator/antitoxin HigA
MKNTEHFTGVPATYRELVAMHPPRQIHNESESAAASKIIEKMIGHNLNRDQEDYMDLLATLVSEYDDQHDPIHAKKLSPLEALKYVMEESGMNASDLGRLLGNRELGSKILRGERGLSMAHISTLAEHFAVSRELFMPALSKSSTDARKPNRSWRGATTKLRNTKR